ALRHQPAPPPLIERAAPRPCIRVCHPLWELAYGGTERQLAQVLPLTLADAFEHTIIVRGSPNDRRQPVPLGVSILVPPRNGTSWRRVLCEHFGELRPDLIHVRGFGMLRDALYAANRTNDIPVAFSFHGLESLDAALPSPRFLLRRALVGCSMRWAVSNTAR